MKKILFISLLLAAISSVSFSRELVASGKTYSALGNYKIELADNPVTINGEKLKTYVISYENSPLKVTVGIQKQRKCKNFIVLSDKLSVQYVCTGNYFGVTRFDNTYKEEGYSTSDAALNRTEYFHQKVITPEKNGEVENTQLIAAYFPMLINTEIIASK
jgi:hypothetical protein